MGGIVLKRFMTLLFTAMMAASAFSLNVYAAPAVPETNLAGVKAFVGLTESYLSQNQDGTAYIQYADGSKESLPSNYIALFINGSIIKNANLILDNDRTLLPLRLISETLGAQVSWDDKQRKVTIEDSGNKIELIIGDMNPKLNGKPITIDVAPRIYNDYTYVPVRFVAEALGCKVDWFDGRTNPTSDNPILSAPHYFYRIPQVMISRYPQGAVPMSKDNALETARAQIIKAYNNIYGNYTSLETKPAAGSSDADSFRYQISHISVISENDRFYCINFGWEMWVDKYTGAIYNFYPGQVMYIWRFDPNSPNALTFAG